MNNITCKDFAVREGVKPYRKLGHKHIVLLVCTHNSISLLFSHLPMTPLTCQITQTSPIVNRTVVNEIVLWNQNCRHFTSVSPLYPREVPQDLP
jgi:hypothetical protein